MPPGVRYDRLVAVANAVALAAALLAWRLGAATSRMRPTVLFLAASTVLAMGWVTGALARARRLRERDSRPIEWDVPLTEPLWARIGDACAPLAFAAMLGAAASLAGAPGVGAGISTTIGVLTLIPVITLQRWMPRSLMFAADGLHVAVGRCRFLVAWSDISGVRVWEGGSHVELTLLSFQRVAATIVSSDERARSRAAALLHDGSGVTARLLVPAALAGVEGGALARDITDSAGRRTAVPPN